MSKVAWACTHEVGWQLGERRGPPSLDAGGAGSTGKFHGFLISSQRSHVLRQVTRQRHRETVSLSHPAQIRHLPANSAHCPPISLALGICPTHCHPARRRDLPRAS
ncbi:hypothetical protein EVAR_61017_1 [Eumeta japonica]|uniref:Uncharacterized protein n=1 Tax=Eumeta variegata TaxID=151549 RepID=A0A4C1ZCS7_EUMVA|nr:hypothetical protein EVAR_61017_1 [Eumeta japonica]